MTTIRIAIAQINTIVGDIRGNRDKIISNINQAGQKSADLVVFPELTLTGYPPEDLLLRQDFVKENIRCLKDIAIRTKDIIAIVGFVDIGDKKALYNSAGILTNKRVLYSYHKKYLPNYSVFDEKRYFQPGTEDVILKTQDFSFSVNICEDIWAGENSEEQRVLSQSQFLVNISASPYHLGKIKERQVLLSSKSRRFKIPIVYCNLIGGQDELIFDGRSMVLDKEGRLIVGLKAFEEDLVIVDLGIGSQRHIEREKGKKVLELDHKMRCKDTVIFIPKRPDIFMDKDKEVYSALVLGLRDYVQKNNFTKVILGLSGGIDSGLVASIAKDALGNENILALSMPSRYSSNETQQDAERVANNLGISFIRIPIDGIFDLYLDTLKGAFSSMKADITEENIQARIRGNILMAFSNKFGHLVLNTGNKSETSVGYCTLYGDMAGGFAVIKDVPKKLVYELTRFVNLREGKEIIPNSIFERPPTAELRPGQKDQDTLPPYDLLDEIIELYIEKNKAFNSIVKELGNKDIVEKVLKMICQNEYKRRQSPLGIKITPCSFGKDRRLPITNRFTG